MRPWVAHEMRLGLIVFVLAKLLGWLCKSHDLITRVKRMAVFLITKNYTRPETNTNILKHLVEI
jgi:hypothetical protein